MLQGTEANNSLSFQNDISVGSPKSILSRLYILVLFTVHERIPSYKIKTRKVRNPRLTDPRLTIYRTSELRGLQNHRT